MRLLTDLSLADARNRDENLQFVRERLLRSDLDRAALLDTYAKVCRKERVVETITTRCKTITLAGCPGEDGCLRLRNRSIRGVRPEVVPENLPDADSRGGSARPIARSAAVRGAAAAS